MSSSFGQALKITIFGESHSSCVGLTIDSLPAGIYLDKDYLEKELAKRRTNDTFSTKRKEEDKICFLSGVFNNHTTGTPLTFILLNKDADSTNYQKGVIRPSHSDLTYHFKYHGFNDYRGGGFSSGRVTAPLIVLGAIIKSILKDKGIIVGSHISSVGLVNDDQFDFKQIKKQLMDLENDSFPTLNKVKEKEMKETIHDCNKKLDSIGGRVETAIYNLPMGIGEPFFDSVESYISHLIFSIGGVKGIIFGDSNVSTLLSSEYNDELEYLDNSIRFKSNHNGGINGGISNGEVIYFKTLIKPLPSIKKTQKTINVITQENIDLDLNGRFDGVLVHRVLPVINALTYFAIYDLMLMNRN